MLASCTSNELVETPVILVAKSQILFGWQYKYSLHDLFVDQHVILLGSLTWRKDRGGPIEKPKSQNKPNPPRRWPNRPIPSLARAVRQRSQQPVLRLVDSP